MDKNQDTRKEAMETMPDRSYFFTESEDARMEEQNKIHWQALIERVDLADQQGSLPAKPWDVLDIGCHTGGLLKLLHAHWGSEVFTLNGVEPIPEVRKKARERLLGGVFWEAIEQMPDQRVDVVVSHEVLYLVADLGRWMQELKRILRPTGGAFIALRSHGENTAWLRWRSRLRELYGHVSYRYQPMDILRMGAEQGFEMYLHRIPAKPLESLRYSPPEHGWGEFDSADEMFRFHNEWKYLFTFYPRQ